MAKVFIEEQTLTDIADAVRAKNGTTAPIKTVELATAITNIPAGGGTIEPLEVTENGTYAPPEGVDGYAPVTVAVRDTELPKITDASYFFAYNSRLEEIDKWRPLLEDCESLEFLFFQCRNIKSPPWLNTSKCIDFGGMFNYCQEITSVPQYDTSNGMGFSNTFNTCSNVVDLSHLDMRNATEMHRAFYSCRKLIALPQIDTSSCTSLTGAFFSCNALVTIPPLDVDKCKSFSDMFTGCFVLTNLTLYNIRASIQIGSGTSWGHLLTVDSLVNTIQELCTVTTTQTLTMGSANLAKIADLYCKITDDTNEKLTMELCESTDEGAMTLSDYAGLKNWQLK